MDVKNGLYSRDDFEFVDPEYEFKVRYVQGAKNHGDPYFRLYYSYEDYKKLFPDRADKYAFVSNMRRYDESRWHKGWKIKVSDFCETEKYIKDPIANKWKYADAFNPNTNTCIEFQHSYIADDFEERNEFYSNLGINIVWLYDLPKATVREDKDGIIEILEDNARGFFRVSEKPENLKDHPVYIQVKSGMIYRVTELDRREIASEFKSSIRFFKPAETFTEDSFIEHVRDNVPQAVTTKSLYELWNSKYEWMVVEDIMNHQAIWINRDNSGNMFRSFESGCIQYKYVTLYKTGFFFNSFKDYSLSNEKAWSRTWKLINTGFVTSPDSVRS